MEHWEDCALRASFHSAEISTCERRNSERVACSWKAVASTHEKLVDVMAHDKLAAMGAHPCDTGFGDMSDTRVKSHRSFFHGFREPLRLVMCGRVGVCVRPLKAILGRL